MTVYVYHGTPPEPILDMYRHSKKKEECQSVPNRVICTGVGKKNQSRRELAKNVSFGIIIGHPLSLRSKKRFEFGPRGV